MKKATLAILLSTILVLSLAATMALGEPIREQTQQQDQDCGENCSPEDCEPIEHGYEYLHESPGPHCPKQG